MAPLLTTHDLRTQGLSDNDIRRLVRRGALRRVRQRVYATDPAPADALTALIESCLAALRLLPDGSLMCHVTAAALYGYVPPIAGDVHVLLPPGDRHDRLAAVQLHEDRAAEPTERLGVPCTSRLRTILDVARTSSREQAVRLLDAAGQQEPDLLGAAQLTEPRELPRRGRRLAPARAKMATGLAESPLETLAMLLWRDSGLPLPVQQAVIRVAGQFCGRVDFLWPAAKLIVEVDGLAKYADPTEWQREKIRQNRLVAAGYTILRFTWADITQRPEVTVAQIDRALRRAGAITAAPR